MRLTSRITFFLLLLSPFIVAQKHVDTTYYSPGAIWKITTTEGEKGTVETYSRQGKIEKKEEFLDHLPDGLSTTYINSGNIIEKTEFRKGCKTGISKIYNPAGVMLIESYYNKDTLDGTQTKYYENGGIQSQENFVNGLKIGKAVYYYKSGKKSSECTFDTLRVSYNGRKPASFESVVNSVQQGRARVWYESGYLKSDGTFNKGKKNGTYKEWYENGKLLEEYNYVNDVTSGRQRSYHPNGNLSTDITLVLQYDSVKKFNTFFNEGDFLKFDANKNPLVKGFYKNKKRQGRWQEFEGGKIKIDSWYNKGFLVDDYKTYFPNTEKPYIFSHYKMVSRNGKDTSCMDGETVTYHLDGVVSGRLLYRDCHCVSSVTYFDDGVMSGKAEIVDSLVYRTQYYKNGKTESRYVAKYDSSKDVNSQKFELLSNYYENGKTRREYYNVLAPLSVEKQYNDSGIVVFQRYRIQDDIGIETDFYNSGKLRSEDISISQGYKTPGMQYVEWFENGRLKRFENYSVYQVNWLSDGSFYSSYAYDQLNINMKHDTVIDPAVIQSLYSNLSKSSKRSIDLQHPEGRIFSTYDDHKTKIETLAENGKINGYLRSYFYSGKPMMEFTLKNGVLDGPFHIYLESGVIKTSGNYCMGKLCGTWLECNVNADTLSYYEYEKPVNKSDYNKNYIFKKEYFSSFYNGKYSKHLQSFYNYKDGKQDGWQIDYNPNGTLNSRRMVVDGKELGLIKRFWENGKVSEEYTLDSLGRKQGFYQRGNARNVIMTANYKDGKLDGPYENFWPNGKLYHKGMYAMDQKAGVWETFDSTGVKTGTDKYDNGTKESGARNNVCGCKTTQRKIGFAPKITDLMDIKRADIWQFGFHEPLTKYLDGLFYVNYQTDQSGDGTNRFTGLDVLAYKEMVTRLPNSKGLQLVLNPCHKFQEYSRISLTINTTKGDPNETRMEINPEMLAFRFEKKLLLPLDTASFKATEAGFKVKYVEYSKEGIELHDPQAVCFNPSAITGTKAVISLGKFVPYIKQRSSLLDFPGKNQKPSGGNNFTGIAQGEGTLGNIEDATFSLPLENVRITENAIMGIIVLNGTPEDSEGKYTFGNGVITEAEALAKIKTLLGNKATLQTEKVDDQLRITFFIGTKN